MAHAAEVRIYKRKQGSKKKASFFFFFLVACLVERACFHFFSWPLSFFPFFLVKSVISFFFSFFLLVFLFSFINSHLRCDPHMWWDLEMEEGKRFEFREAEKLRHLKSIKWEQMDKYRRIRVQVRKKNKPSYRVNSFKIQSKVCATYGVIESVWSCTTYGVIESMDLYSLGLKELASRLFWPA